MEQTVYGDLFFLVNFSMDFLCLFLTARLLHRRLSLPRALIASAVGGLYSVLALLLPLGRWTALLADAAVCGLLCILTFGERKKQKQLPLCALVLVAVSIALGGLMTALFYLLNRTPLSGAMGGEGDGISVWAFALLALISGVLTLLGGRLFGRRAGRKNALVTVTYEGRERCLRAMTDSGNLLKDPLGGRPCILVEPRALRGILPEELLKAAESEPPSVGAISHKHGKNISLIPTATASGSGLLLGIRVERITVDLGEGAVEVDAMLALCRGALCADGNEALLPAELCIG